MQKRSNIQGKKRGDILFFLLFPIVLIYSELLFKVSTVGGLFSMGTIYTIVFSFVYGGVFYLLTSIFKNKKINRIIAVILLILIAVLFLVEYFVYMEFKVFYDVNTVMGAAGDVAGDFMGEVLSLIFCFNGLSKIFLFFIPVILYAVAGRRFAPARCSNTNKRVLTMFGVFIVFVFNVLVLASSSVYGPMYSEEYRFQDAVGNFGLISGVRMDISKAISGESASEGGFEKVDPVSPSNTTTTTATSSEGNETAPTTTTTYGLNAMDFDFAALAESESKSSVKNIHSYLSSISASSKNQYTGLFKGKNLIFITAEAFSAEVVDKDLTPTLYRMATKGINFTDYYQPASAGTTGGEYENVFGLLPMQGGKSFKNKVNQNNYFTMGFQLDRLGYYGKAYHNNTYTYYDRDKTHNKIGYSDGYMGMGNGMEKYVAKTWPESDQEMIAGTLTEYIDKAPFNIYYMSVSGHGVYGKNNNAMSKKHWDKVASKGYSEPVTGYLAANLDLEYAMQYLISELENKGIADDTVVCISSDHFPYGLDNDAKLGDMPYLSELYGYEVTNYLQRDHSRLIIWSGCLEKNDPIIVDSPTFSLDILPTLSNLFGTEFDSRLMPGRDALSDAEAIVFNTGYDWKTDLGYYISSTGKFTPNDDNTEIPEGYVDRIKAIVRNKIKFCSSMLDVDYLSYLKF